MADQLTSTTEYVVTRTLTSADWANTVLVPSGSEDELVDRIRALKAGDGPELVVLGSSQLVRCLSAHGLVDEYRLWTYPVVLGAGKRWFDEALAPAGLELVDLTRSSTGVLMTTYGRSGPVPSGSFALETPSDAEVARRDSGHGVTGSRSES
jgi:dihydrofolate reductase